MKKILNTEKALFEGVGKYGIPEILPIDNISIDGLDPVCINYMNVCKNPEKSFLHFFIDDYFFERLWNSPDRYIPILKKFKYVIGPDYSLYTDHPRAVQIWNHYRKHWLTRYYQEAGINMIPCICWSDEASFDWCFDGEPVNSIIATSTVGPYKRLSTRKLFEDGFNEMIERLNPSKIILNKWETTDIKCDVPVESFNNFQMSNKQKVYRSKEEN